jgi:hypothetical protein
LTQLEAVVAKLITAVTDAARLSAKGLADAPSRLDLDRSIENLSRRFEGANECSTKQILCALADLADETRKLTVAVRDISNLIRDARVEGNKPSEGAGLAPLHQPSQSSRLQSPAALGLASATPPRPPLETENKSPTRSTEPIEKIIMAHFDELDRATNRNFPSLKSEFRQSLGDRVSDINLQDDAVLFYTSPERAIVHPWRNVPLNRAWHPFFELRGRSNVPIRKVNRPAVIVKREEGGWTPESMGDIENVD